MRREAMAKVQLLAWRKSHSFNEEKSTAGWAPQASHALAKKSSGALQLGHARDRQAPPRPAWRPCRVVSAMYFTWSCCSLSRKAP